MKKLLLASAALFAALGASAANLVVNGDFEDPNFKQEYCPEYIGEEGVWFDHKYVTELPGWVHKPAVWVGGVEILTGDEYYGDGDIRPEDDKAFAHFVGYDNNGWTNITMHQIVTGLTPGENYTLSFLVAANFPTGAWGEASDPAPDCGFMVAKVSQDKDGKDAAGAGIASKNVADDADYELGVEFDMPYIVTFDAPADGKVWLEFYLANKYYEGNKKEGLYMDLDLVKMMTTEEFAGISTITAAAETEAPVEYFNLQGVRVAQPENGLYIRRQGNKTTKVVL